MRSLSQAQLRALQLIVDDPENSQFGWGSSNINPTMSALERRGLAKCEYDRSKGIFGFPWCRWVPTEMGKDFLAQHQRPATPNTPDMEKVKP